MEKCKWSFQLLLEVFASYTEDAPMCEVMSSPIISSIMLRDELVEFDFPFMYTYVLNGGQRYNDTGTFTQTDGDIIFEFSNDKYHLSSIEIGSIITRHQLLHC